MTMKVMERKAIQEVGRRCKAACWGTLFLVLATALGACSDDDDGGSGNEEAAGGTTSTIISATNANMPAAGTVTAQYGDSPAGMDISKLVDTNVTTSYETKHSNFTVTYQADQAVRVNFYTVRIGSGAADGDPTAWTLSGSDDNAQWTELDRQAGQTFPNRYSAKEILFENSKAYRYYRLQVEANNGGAATRIAEWSLEWKNISTTPEEPHSIVLGESNGLMPTGGTLTAQYSDYPEDEDISYLVDASLGTPYTTSHTEFYILWEGDEAAAVNYYCIVSANDDPQNAPSAWVLSGSNDNSQWTQIDAQSLQVFNGRLEKKEFLLTNETAYKYYKLEIRDNNGGSQTQIGQFSLNDEFNIDDLMAYASGWSTSTVTPMGNHFENRHVTTDADRAWLLDPDNDPDPKMYGSDWTLKEFPVTLYPFGEPLPADVNQHAIGNCSALAIFGAMVYVYPEFIKSLITDNGDNTYTIDMFDPQGQPVQVCVSNKFFADGGGNMPCCTGKNSQATWSTVLEKALMKWQTVYKVNENVGGIGSEHVAPLFTGEGNSFAFSPGKLDADQLTRAVKVLLAQGMIVVGGFNRADMVAQDGSGKTVTGHAWTLMWSNNPSALFAMRNPWGFCYDAPGELDGVLNVFRGEMPSTIDLRVIYPGKAAQYGSGRFDGYTPPSFAPQPRRVAEHLLRSGM